jgi:hypothetical protein
VQIGFGVAFQTGNDRGQGEAHENRPAHERDRPQDVQIAECQE